MTSSVLSMPESVREPTMKIVDARRRAPMLLKRSRPSVATVTRRLFAERPPDPDAPAPLDVDAALKADLDAKIRYWGFDFRRGCRLEGRHRFDWRSEASPQPQPEPPPSIDTGAQPARIPSPTQRARQSLITDYMKPRKREYTAEKTAEPTKIARRSSLDVSPTMRFDAN